jgi:D-lactate dehydrogenase
VEQFVGQERIFTDPVRTFAYGTDASFYRLNPKMVIKVRLGRLAAAGAAAAVA